MSVPEHTDSVLNTGIPTATPDGETDRRPSRTRTRETLATAGGIVTDRGLGAARVARLRWGSEVGGDESDRAEEDKTPPGVTPPRKVGTTGYLIGPKASFHAVCADLAQLAQQHDPALRVFIYITGVPMLIANLAARQLVTPTERYGRFYGFLFVILLIIITTLIGSVL